MSSSGSHHIPVHLGTTRISIHSREYIEGSERFRCFGGLWLLFDVRLYCDVHFQTVAAERETHATGNDIPEQEAPAERPAGKQRVPEGDGTAPGDPAEPAVHPAEHRHVRRLQEPVVHVETAAGADTAVRGLLQATPGKHRPLATYRETTVDGMSLRQPYGRHRTKSTHPESGPIHAKPVSVPPGPERFPQVGQQPGEQFVAKRNA